MADRRPIICANVGEGSPEAEVLGTVPLMAALGDGVVSPIYAWIVLIQNTGETYTKTMPSGETKTCLKLYAYLCVEEDLNTVDNDHILWKYSSVIPYVWKNALSENSVVVKNFSGGTTADGSTVPTHTKDGVTHTAANCIRSDVYVPADECEIQAFFNFIIDTTSGEEFDKSLFIYSRKGSLKASDEVITGYGTIPSMNVVDAKFGTAIVDPKVVSSTTTTRSTTAAAVDARLSKVAERPYLRETSDDGVYSLA